MAEFHVQQDAMTVNIATTEQIYNEFSSGKQDLMALRAYVKMFYDRAQTESDVPENVLLFGDASYDYKGITSANGLYDDVNFVPTFQSEYSFKIGPSFCTDDFIAFLDESEGAQNTMSTDGMDLGVGRIVCQTINEAQAVVDKIINYNSKNLKSMFRENWELEINPIKTKCQASANAEMERYYKEFKEKKTVEWTEMFGISDYKTIIDKYFDKRENISVDNSEFNS